MFCGFVFCACSTPFAYYEVWRCVASTICLYEEHLKGKRTRASHEVRILFNEDWVRWWFGACSRESIYISARFILGMNGILTASKSWWGKKGAERMNEMPYVCMRHDTIDGENNL